MKNLSEILINFFNFQAFLGKKYVEIRFIKTKQGIISGIFETTEQGAKALANEIKRLGLEKESMYHTINILSDEYVNNFAAQYKINTLYPNTKKTTSDADISRIRLIMLDFDPKRASGISSTDDEKAKAKECMDSLITALTFENFPLPAYITDSGNGYNAYLMVDFPNDKEHNKLIADFIKIVHDKYSDDFVDVDKSPKNPARIAKVAGSWSVKGDNTAERPHRQCKLLETHTDVTPVTAEQLTHFIEDNKPKKSVSKKKEKPRKVKIYDVKGWLDSHEIEYQEKEADLDGSHCKIYILKDCPFEKHDNQNCSFLARFDDMSVIFKCHHTHCTQNIHDFIAVYPLPKQIPLLSGDDKKVELYNNIVLTAKLMNDNNKKPYIMLDNKVIPFE